MTKPAIHPDDFPVETSKTTVKTNKGKPLADAESEPVAEEIAERLNEHAYREEHERWSP
ncbi:hypothetical protein NLM27_21605 [Bradyrhizobium sp. CCGB12]|uniref:hypothetical protein n=1 Tax=Bradyrhizobium sp. CCGB12 TaxID=2949632 RepID=UPI0020B1E9FC|nr:hypothetical protein [Bradyrhizobium sp. CCGB12]MCP3391386.1 hypothetical protein [Bradyrhizobium sp. CCGB12]